MWRNPFYQDGHLELFLSFFRVHGSWWLLGGSMLYRGFSRIFNLFLKRVTWQRSREASIGTRRARYGLSKSKVGVRGRDITGLGVLGLGLNALFGIAIGYNDNGVVDLLQRGV